MDFPSLCACPESSLTNLIGWEYHTITMRKLRKLDLPRGHNSWCWAKGSWPLGTRMTSRSKPECNNWKLTKLTCSKLTWVDRALDWCHRGWGFESRSSLSCIHNCDDLPCTVVYLSLATQICDIWRNHLLVFTRVRFNSRPQNWSASYQLASVG